MRNLSWRWRPHSASAQRVSKEPSKTTNTIIYPQHTTCFWKSMRKLVIKVGKPRAALQCLPALMLVAVTTMLKSAQQTSPWSKTRTQTARIAQLSSVMTIRQVPQARVILCQALGDPHRPRTTISITSLEPSLEMTDSKLQSKTSWS